MAVAAIDEHGAQPAGERARDVVVEVVADHHRRLGRRAPERERGGEDRRARLAPAMRRGREREVDADAELGGERRELAVGVGDEADGARGRPQHREQRQDVGEELEVAGIAPGRLGRLADLLGDRLAGAHAARDLDREAPVLGAPVLERLGVPDVERAGPGGLVAPGVEPHPEAARRARHSRARRRRATGGSA